MHIPTQFCNLSNVLPEEQEEMIFNELKFFLLGTQTENIRISEFDGNLPSQIEVNISFDPYIRSELERFTDILLATATIKICCYGITHDAYNYSTIPGTVASEIEKKVNQVIYKICENLDGHLDANQQLNNLFREVNAVAESFQFYKEIVKTIYKEHLIGGQVLSLIDAKRRHVYSPAAIQDLEDVFQAGWRVFARYIGRLVCRFEGDSLNFEFVIWSIKTAGDSTLAAKIMAPKLPKSTKFVVVDELCPSFFHKYLDILVRCAEFGDASKIENARSAPPPPLIAEKGGGNVENLMNDVRNVDWSGLDVAATVRMLVQFSRKESACLLKKITSATNVDQAICDIHELLLRGAQAHEVMSQCVKSDILCSPIDEIGSSRLKKLTQECLGAASEKHRYFWRYFSFTIETKNVFEHLAERMLRGAPTEKHRQNYTPPLFECLSLTFNCPIEIEPIVSSNAVHMLLPVFRIWLQLHVATWKLANERDILRGMMPLRSGSDLALKKHLLNSFDWEISNLKKKYATFVDVALISYRERVSKAVSLDEYVESQDILARDITKMMKIMESTDLDIIKDMLNIIWAYESPEVTLGDLIVEFEEIQSRAKMGEVTLA
ncbi:unnamed protein product [Caenorhabditis bovis]|uniref:Gamma tubulin complex component protein N-terminal domain-containing protein n=1 Tax=Caenorhabditis bovis TaxID=2654633 RepID=A0A8S1FET0_9PELO|nr:unnamed protein product [Caenorhabditis bovis]